ncbi:MAG: DUF2294 domain-containing protein [Elainella sp. Prado103]|jgi:uncharacterized protein YbcI|nr:DUF2294 domain-containing protein [Elainella sp. Prado103]
MTTQTLTRGQLERNLSQQIQSLYRIQLGHQPSKVTCQLFDEKLAIIIENSVTQPEQLLAEEGKLELAEQVRADLDQAMRPQLRSLVETELGVTVLDLLSDATLETGRTGMIVVLENSPPVRQSSSGRKGVNQESDSEVKAKQT